jgi:Flp pilus assembly protein TadG
MSHAPRGQRAQSLLEFALVIPLFLLLMFGLIDFSRLLFSYISIVNGARDLARAASISSRSTAGTEAITAFQNLTIIGGTTSGATSITLTPSGGGSGACTSLTSVGCSFTLGTGSSTTTITATSGGHSSATGASATISGSYMAPSALGISANGDYVAITWVDSVAGAGQVQICPLPLQTACAASVSNNWAQGFVQVDVVYTFNFNPLFQNRLAGIVDASFLRPTSLLTTSARSYIE